jgi:hypothetical protein
MKTERKKLKLQVIALVATSYGVDASTLTVDTKITEDFG